MPSQSTFAATYTMEQTTLAVGSNSAMTGVDAMQGEQMTEVLELMLAMLMMAYLVGGPEMMEQMLGVFEDMRSIGRWQRS